MIRILGIFCITASLYAQLSGSFGGNGIDITGEVRPRAEIGSNEFLVEVYDVRTGAVVARTPVIDGRFEFDHVPAGSYMVRVVTAAGNTPIVEESHQFQFSGESLVLNLPERSSQKPISGLVSLRELEHPVPKKALRDAYRAQQLERAGSLPKAIEKLQEAIHIAPFYRDAHVNLGVLYARSGRTADAKTEFQKAIEIGPPAAPMYADLALTYLVLHQYAEAQESARKALQLDPANSGAQRTLQYAGWHNSAANSSGDGSPQLVK